MTSSEVKAVTRKRGGIITPEDVLRSYPVLQEYATDGRPFEWSAHDFMEALHGAALDPLTRYMINALLAQETTAYDGVCMLRNDAAVLQGVQRHLKVNILDVLEDQ